MRHVLWDALGPGRGQAIYPIPPPHLSGGVGLARRHIVGVMPVQEAPKWGGNATARGKVMFIPELMGPPMVEGLNFPVIVGFVLRGKEDLAAQVPTEADDRAES